MTQKILTRSLVLIVSLACSAAAFAQAAGKAPDARYDRTAEVQASGIITGVISAPAPDGPVGVHLQVKTATGIINVHVGPALFIGDNNFYFFADDQVQVTGALVGHGIDAAMWARTVTKGGKTLILRNEDGTPRWTLATAEDPDGCGVPHAPIRN